MDDKKLTLLDFSFSLFKTKQKLLRQKTVAAGEYEKEKEVLSVKDDGQEAEDVSLGTSASIQPV